MVTTSSQVRKALHIGTSLAVALGATLPSMAYAATGVDDPVPGEYANADYDAQLTATSHGETKLYVVAKGDDIATEEGAADSQLKVSVPVAIHYVAKADGTLVGPKDDIVKFVNHTRLGSVHISKIAVTSPDNTTIARAADVGTNNDTLSLSITPQTGAYDGTSFVPSGEAGHPDELGTYSSTSASGGSAPTNPDEWDIAQGGGAKALNKLTGTVGGFDELDPWRDTQIGTIHWTIRAGTHAQAAIRDDTVTIHYNSNNGFNKNSVPVADQRVRISTGGDDTLTGASGVDGPKSITQADGSVTTYTFKEWNTKPDGRGTAVSKASQLPDFETLGNKTVELYAIFNEETA